MYESYWGLDGPPFQDAHIAETFVDNSTLQLARVKLVHMVKHGHPALAVVGPAGVGKTALAMETLRELSAQQFVCSLIVNPGGKPHEVLDCIASDLGGSGPHPMASLENALLGLTASGRRACILVDEAHAISDRQLLECFRMLLNVEIGGSLPLSMILVGQPSLVSVLRQVSSFDQRLSLTIPLHAMSPDESKFYILSRLKLAGCRRGIFTRSAGERISQLAGGIPRNINRLCELCLVVGFGFGVNKIKTDIVDVVAGDLGLTGLEVDAFNRSGSTSLLTPESPRSSLVSIDRDQKLEGFPPVDGEDVLASIPFQPRVSSLARAGSLSYFSENREGKSLAENPLRLALDSPSDSRLPLAEVDILSQLVAEGNGQPEDIMGSL